jgi:hypothetical protein
VHFLFWFVLLLCLQGSYGCYLYEITQKGELWAISDERLDAFHSVEILASFML